MVRIDLTSSSCPFLIRSSNNSIQEIPFIKRNSSITRSSIAQISEQWPPPFLLNQSPTFPASIATQPTVPSSQPKRHPLRRESTLPGYSHERRESTLWPFRTVNAVFHKQTSEIKPNDLFYTAWRLVASFLRHSSCSRCLFSKKSTVRFTHGRNRLDWVSR